MAITTSAKKAHRASLRRHIQNNAHRDAVRGALKALRAAPKGDQAALAKAYKEIDKARKRGIIKKNTAARRKSKAAKLFAGK